MLLCNTLLDFSGIELTQIIISANENLHFIHIVLRVAEKLLFSKLEFFFYLLKS